MKKIGPILICLLIFTACEKEKISTLERKELFQINIGRLEDEIDYFQLSDQTVFSNPKIFMEEGLFYISSGYSGKLMIFNSYGHLLSLFYNPDLNPTPISLSMRKQDFSASRLAWEYPFNDLGPVLVNSPYLYIANKVSTERLDKDKDNNSILNQHILVFKTDGNFMGFLGREGIGGSPLPPVLNMESNVNKELIVTTRMPQMWAIYWYNQEGELLYRVHIPYEDLPQLKDDKLALPHLQRICPDYYKNKLYLMLIYYSRGNNSTSSGSEQHYISTSRLYSFSLETRKFKHVFSVPFEFPENNEQPQSNNPIIYDYMGCIQGLYHVFLAPLDKKRYHLKVFNEKGKSVLHRYLKIMDKYILYKDFNLSKEGILSALFIYNEKALVHWWRLDNFLKDLKK